MNLKGILYLCIALLTYAFTQIVEKIGVTKGVDSSVFSFFSIFFGLCVVGIVWMSLRKKRSLHLDKKYIKRLFILGTLGSGLAVVLSITALKYTTATNKAVMQAMYASFTLIFAYFMIHERMPRLFYPTFLAMVCGLILLTSKGLLHLPNKGDWMLLISVPIVGYCNVYAKKI